MTLWDKILLVSGVCLGYGIIISVVAFIAYGFVRAWLWASEDKEGDSEQ